MKWELLCAWLIQARKDLKMEAGRPHPGWLAGQRPEWTKEAEEALRHYSDHLEWPELPSRPVRYQLYIRLLFGLDSILQLTDKGMPPPPGEAAVVFGKYFRVTVIDAWHHDGPAWLDRRFPTSGAWPDSS